jgi:hypothetical protein
MSRPHSWRKVAPGEEGATTISALEDRWIEECGGHRVHWDEAWLCGRGDGFATFLGGLRWELTRVWVRPELRRQGLLEVAWPRFVECYGAAFKVWQPSPAMQAFLAKVRHPTGANTGARRDPTNKDGG